MMLERGEIRRGLVNRVRGAASERSIVLRFGTRRPDGLVMMIHCLSDYDSSASVRAPLGLSSLWCEQATGRRAPVLQAGLSIDPLEACHDGESLHRGRSYCCQLRGRVTSGGASGVSSE